jgi:predicted phosphodiesterase
MTRIAVCGGVYSNPFALRAFLDDAASRGCERLFCLGDLGGFGADCAGVWPLLQRGGGVECIAGNYDVAIGRGDEDCGCGYSDERDNRSAQVIYDHTRASTPAAFAAWMRELPGELRVQIEGVDIHMVHGSPHAVNEFLWESTPDSVLGERVASSGADVLLCTHTGIPWQRSVDGCLVVNVGAVGRPANDGRRDAWYAVLDLEHGSARAELVPLAYDWRAQAASMRAAGLPEEFVETIETGWWTTCLEVVPPRERSRGRFHVYADALPTDFADGAAAREPGGSNGSARSNGGAPLNGAAASNGAAAVPDRERPVVSLFDSPVFPARLWAYTNFDCNCACDYCAVASSPRARKRSLGLERFRALVDEAVVEGFRELYVTGGEPFIERDIVAMLEYASERLPTVCLTNAMLFRGRRGSELPRLAGRGGDLVLQSSLDGARPETHDRHRGAGSWRAAVAGIGRARELGLPVRVAMTETPANRGEIADLRTLLEGLGVRGEDFAVRPLVRRGFAAEGQEVSDAVMIPELTITADGAHWHPVGADLESSPDLLLAPGAVSLAEAKRRVIERFLELREADGSLPRAYHCAV